MVVSKVAHNARQPDHKIPLAPSTTSPHDQHPFQWKVGDRVIVHSLKKASHLNGRHGCIGGAVDVTTGRYPIDFDLPVISNNNSSSQSQQQHQHQQQQTQNGASNRVMAKAENLKREPQRMFQQQQQHNDSAGNNHIAGPFHRAGVTNGILVEEEGRPLCLLLDAIRFVVGNIIFQDPELQTGLMDIETLRRQGQEGLGKMYLYMQSAWSHWEHNRHNQQHEEDYNGERRPSIYLLLLQFFEEFPRVNNATLAEMPQEFHVARAALYHPTAVQGWDTRIQGDFWVLPNSGWNDDDGNFERSGADRGGGQGDDGGGTYLVSHFNYHSVYKVFGLRHSLSQVIRANRSEDEGIERPVLLTVTLLPWYGRLVFDGTCTPAHEREATPKVADQALAEELHQSVSLARREGRVVGQIAQLHLAAAAAAKQQQMEARQPPEQLDDDGGEEESRQQAPRETVQLPPTEEELDLLQCLEDIPVASADEAIWCMRRVGYTEEENPAHEIIIINGAVLGGGVTIGKFACSSLIPESEDILQALLDYCDTNGIGDSESESDSGSDSTDSNVEEEDLLLPAIVLIDDFSCFERVQYLLKTHTPDVFSLKAVYYPPPTPEETAAALLDQN